MAHDDMHVVVFKILSYLYSCMRKGERPCERHLRHDGDVLAIPYRYWATVIKDMLSRGYVEGFVVTESWGGDPMVAIGEPRITMEGVEFLQSNSMMARALGFLRETKSALPFI